VGLEVGLLRQEERLVELAFEGLFELRIFGAELGPQVVAVLLHNMVQGEDRMEGHMSPPVRIDILVEVLQYYR